MRWAKAAAATTMMRTSAAASRVLIQNVAQDFSPAIHILSGSLAFWQYQFVVLVRRLIDRRARVPRRNRLLVRRIQRLHRFPYRIDTIGEEIADQQIGDRAA